MNFLEPKLVEIF